jgi:hypothetical protein
MRLPTRVHGMLDYLLGALLIALPWVAGFARGGAESWVPVAIGATLLAYSAVTDYELSLLRRLATPTHLLLDGLAGVALAVSPWLFGFDQTVWLPHVIAGVWAIVTATLTDTIPRYDRRRAGQG